MARKTWSIEQLKKKRLSRQWSQEKLAEVSGLSTRTIQRIEKGHKVDMTSVTLLASALDTEIEELIYREQTVSIVNPKYANLEQFKTMVVLAIILVVCMFILALFPEEGDDMRFEFLISVMGSYFMLVFMAEKTLYPGATKDFMERVFPQKQRAVKLSDRYKVVKTILWFLVNLLILSILFPQFF